MEREESIGVEPRSVGSAESPPWVRCVGSSRDTGGRTRDECLQARFVRSTSAGAWARRTGLSSRIVTRVSSNVLDRCCDIPFLLGCSDGVFCWIEVSTSSAGRGLACAEHVRPFVRVLTGWRTPGHSHRCPARREAPPPSVSGFIREDASGPSVQRACVTGRFTQSRGMFFFPRISSD